MSAGNENEDTIHSLVGEFVDPAARTDAEIRFYDLFSDKPKTMGGIFPYMKIADVVVAKNTVHLLPDGTRVRLKGSNTEGITTGATVRGGNIQYDISYFLGGEKRSEWMRDFEIEEITAGDNEGVGFLKK